MKTDKKVKLANRRHQRVRQRVIGTAARPRMSVAFTNQHIYVQFIDDEAGVTLASVSTLGKSLDETRRSAANRIGAQSIGLKAAEHAMSKGLKEVVFDRGSARYHWTGPTAKSKVAYYGKVATLAEAARSAGLIF